MSTLLSRAASCVSTVGLAASLAFACCSAAHAQWVWRDATGNTTFSDSPPPPDIKPSDILRRPFQAGGSDSTSRSGGSGSSSGSSYSASNGTGDVSSGQPAPPSDAPPPKPAAKSWAEQDADFRRRQVEREKAEQKQAEDEARAKEKADQCEQARGYLQMLQEGTRIMRPDAEGNRNFMDDDQRAAEQQKAQDNISKNCS